MPLRYEGYQNERQLPDMVTLIEKDLSEPYSVYTYRYFLQQWPELCFLAVDEEKTPCIVGVIICKLDLHKSSGKNRGYIAMLAFIPICVYFRSIYSGTKSKGSTLVKMALEAMKAKEGEEAVLETEITNMGALRLYQNLGFVRDKRLTRYYLNGVDAFRLKLWFV